MSQDLTTSLVARQNVLNNHYALSELETHLSLGGLQFEEKAVFTKYQVSGILSVDERTIERYLSKHGEELEKNGYEILKGKRLKNIKMSYVDDMNVVDIIDPKVPALGVFSFRSVLNLAMLVTESEQARVIRSRMLDIVLDVVAQKSGGHTKYINQRDEDYLPSSYVEETYRKQFTDALRDFLMMGNHKYAIYTDKIYRAVFREKAKEYKQVLKLAEKDKVRDTMYSEVLKAISGFEHGLAKQMKKESEALGRKLNPQEVDKMIHDAEENPYMRPSIEDARMKMASRDLGFRDALHQKLEGYVHAIPGGDFERFLGEKSQSLEEQLSDPRTLDVLKRLKDR
jgi:hypothetical protein